MIETPKSKYKIPRLLLFLCGAMLCFVGISGAINPSMLSGEAVLEPVGVTSIRVDYGGFHLGLGLFALLGVFRLSFLKFSLSSATLTMTLVVLTRGIGLIVDGTSEAQVTTMIFEAIPFSLSLFGLAAFTLQAKSVGA